MIAWSLRNTHGRSTSIVACHHCHCTKTTIRLRQESHAIIALGQTHGRMTSSMACHHLLLTTHTVIQHRVRFAIIALGLHTRSDNVKRGMPTWALGSINGRTTLGVTCHHRPWAAHTVRFFWAWQACMVLWRHTHSDDIDRCLPSSPLGSTFFRMTSGMACNHRPWETHTVGGHRQGMSSLL